VVNFPIFGAFVVCYQSMLISMSMLFNVHAGGFAKVKAAIHKLTGVKVGKSICVYSESQPVPLYFDQNGSVSHDQKASAAHTLDLTKVVGDISPASWPRKCTVCT